MTLTFNPMQALVMAFSHAKVHSQKLVSSEDIVAINGRLNRQRDKWTVGGNYITSLSDAFINKGSYNIHKLS